MKNELTFIPNSRDCFYYFYTTGKCFLIHSETGYQNAPLQSKVGSEETVLEYE